MLRIPSTAGSTGFDNGLLLDYKAYNVSIAHWTYSKSTKRKETLHLHNAYFVQRDAFVKNMQATAGGARWGNNTQDVVGCCKR